MLAKTRRKHIYLEVKNKCWMDKVILILRVLTVPPCQNYLECIQVTHKLLHTSKSFNLPSRNLQIV